MSPVGWSLGGEPNEEQRRLLAQPFNPSRLTLVVAGTHEHCSWELHDGPHPLIQDPHAVGSSLIVRRHKGGASSGGSVGPALPDGQIASLGYTASGVGARGHGFVEAQCSHTVHRAVVRFDDGSAETLTAAVSPATGQHWIVVPLHDPAAPIDIDFLDDHGEVLLTLAVNDPRRALYVEHQTPEV